jgi:hypothetical protein
MRYCLQLHQVDIHLTVPSVGWASGLCHKIRNFLKFATPSYFSQPQEMKKKFYNIKNDGVFNGAKTFSITTLSITFK